MSEKFSLSTTGDPIERPSAFNLRDDFSSPKLSEIWDAKRILPGSLIITDELEPGGKTVLKITVHPNDLPEEGEVVTERAEITECKETRVPPGTNIWYGFSFYIPVDFEINNERLVIAQWKQPSPDKESNDSPFISYRYQGGDLIAQVVFETQKKKFVLPNPGKGIWHRIVTNYELGEDNQGHCQFIIDDKVIGEYEGLLGQKELEKRDIYFKMGLYRNQSSLTQSIYFDKFRRGSSKDSLA